jgi:hypothetical protein
MMSNPIIRSLLDAITSEWSSMYESQSIVQSEHRRDILSMHNEADYSVQSFSIDMLPHLLKPFLSSPEKVSINSHLGFPAQQVLRNNLYSYVTRSI